ncbi:DUF1508 domain-containing protein [Sinomicrobium oceani]|nr:DUF1508 domain-containing protein [Sinomicrobium oceani]
MIIHAIREHIDVFTITRKCTVSGKFFFRLSKGGLVLATSRKYSTELRLSKGIDEIMRSVSEAETLDFSVDELIFPEEEVAAL